MVSCCQPVAPPNGQVEMPIPSGSQGGGGYRNVDCSSPSVEVRPDSIQFCEGDQQSPQNDSPVPSNGCRREGIIYQLLACSCQEWNAWPYGMLCQQMKPLQYGSGTLIPCSSLSWETALATIAGGDVRGEGGSSKAAAGSYPSQ